MLHSSETNPLSEKEIRNMEKEGVRMMTDEQKEASKAREERIIELGKNGTLSWTREKINLHEGKCTTDRLVGVVKGHKVDVQRKAYEDYNPKRDAYIEGGSLYLASADGISLSSNEAEKLFQKYSGIAPDKAMEQLEELAGESVKRESAEFKRRQAHDQIVSELLGE